MQHDVHETLGRARAMRGQALERLSTLVMAESPSGDAAGIAAVDELLSAAYSATGADVELVAGATAPHLVCRWPSASDDAAGSVLLVGHSDTVFPIGTTTARPFRVLDDGDTVTGPGVYDMKGSLVSVELAMSLIGESGRPLRRPVCLVVVNDEEVGSPDGRRVVAEHAAGAAAVMGLEPPLPDGGLKIGRRGVARVAVTVTGVEAHAGLDAALGVSAIDELIDQLTAVRDHLSTLDGVSVNVGRIDGGSAANVVAGCARAEVGLRFATPDAERRALEAVTELQPRRTGAAVESTLLSHRPAWPADPENPLALEVVRVASDLGLRLTLGVSGGAGDTNHTGIRGTPTVDGLGPTGSGAHGPDELASLDSLLQRAALIAELLVGSS